MIRKEQIIPLIYKDFGRARGQIESAKYFKDLIEGMNHRFLGVNIKPLIVEVSEIKDLYKNKEFREDLLFSFNFVQDLDARGLYPIIARKYDVCFSKMVPPAGFNNEYAQAKLHSEIVGMNYFPKYFLGPMREYRDLAWSWKKLYYKDTLPKQITIGIYYRMDTCPIQSKVYKRFKMLFPDFKYVEIGNEIDNLPHMEAEDFRNKIDMVLYTPPTHSDPWPNTIFECLASSIPVIFIHRKNQVIGSGIQELRMIFDKLFVDYQMEYDTCRPQEIEAYQKIFCIFKDKVLPGEVANFSGDNIKKALRLVNYTTTSVKEQIEKALVDKFKDWKC